MEGEMTSEMMIEDYSDKSFVVRGEATKQYKEFLKSLGGRFNRNLKGGSAWIFPKTKQESVVEFVMKVNSGEDFNLPNGESDEGLPTVPTPDVKTYQFVKFKIFKPKEGMTVQMKTGDKTMEGSAVKVESSNRNDVVDTAYIDFNGSTSLGVICRGKWQIFGYFPEHSLFFK